MSSKATTPDGAAERPVRRLSAALYRRPRLKLGLLLVGPLGWLIGIYLVALGTLLIYGFWQYNDFTSSVDRVASRPCSSSRFRAKVACALRARDSCAGCGC